MTHAFLEYTKGQGNDLSTPRGEFPSLKLLFQRKLSIEVDFLLSHLKFRWISWPEAWWHVVPLCCTVAAGDDDDDDRNDDDDRDDYDDRDDDDDRDHDDHN